MARPDAGSGYAEDSLEHRYYARCLAEGRPYFGPVLGARQGDPARHAVMQAVVAQECGRRGGRTFDILEIGSWAGGSAITWAEALKGHHGGKGRVICVDPWEGYFDPAGYGEGGDALDERYREMTQALATGRIFHLFLHNVRAAGHADVVLPFRGRSEAALPFLADGRFALAFVDGDHTYRGVAEDLRLTARVVEEGGLLCGDDLELPLDAVDADHATRHRERDYVRDPRTGAWYHPGVTLAVGEVLGTVSASQGFWAVRKRGEGWERIELPAVAPGGAGIPDHLRDPGVPSVVIEGHRGYNILRYRDRHYALAQSLGAVDLPPLAEGRFRELLAGGTCHQGTTLDEVKGLADRRPRDLAFVEADCNGYNILRLGDTYYALAQSLGPVDLAQAGEAQLREYAARGACVRGESLDAVKRGIR